MPEEETIPINIVIADRTYRLRIKAEEEEMVRKKTKEVNNKIVEFKTSFAGKDMQDYIAMCLIWYATQSSEEESVGKSSQAVSRFFQNMEEQLDEVLKETGETEV